MSWRDKLQPASFRGVPFRVDASELSSGRRVAVHEYPFKDTPYTEDLGRKGRVIAFDAYLVGLNYLDERDKLLDALDTAGPGELMHPLHGTRNVQAGDYTATETRADGGYIRFSLTFYETTAQPFPKAESDRAAAVDESAKEAALVIDREYPPQIQLDGMPQWAIDQAAGVLDDAGAAMQSALAPVSFAVDYAAEVNRQVQALRVKAVSLVRDPVELALNARSVFDTLAASGGDPLQLSAAMRDFVDALEPGQSGGATATRRRANESASAVQAALRSSAVVEQARQIAKASYASQQAALEARADILDRLDAETATAPDALFQALDGLRATIAAAVPGDDNATPRLFGVTLDAVTPALVLAYRLYADPERGEEIAQRNGVDNPGFLPAAVELQVLSRG